VQSRPDRVGADPLTGCDSGAGGMGPDPQRELRHLGEDVGGVSLGSHNRRSYPLRGRVGRDHDWSAKVSPPRTSPRGFLFHRAPCKPTSPAPTQTRAHLPHATRPRGSPPHLSAASGCSWRSAEGLWCWNPIRWADVSPSAESRPLPHRGTPRSRGHSLPRDLLGRTAGPRCQSRSLDRAGRPSWS
jgi:hypothetical protein